MKLYKTWNDLKNHPDIYKIEDLRKEFKNSGENEMDWEHNEKKYAFFCKIHKLETF